MERCNARTMEIFRRMGLADRIRAAGLPRRRADGRLRHARDERAAAAAASVSVGGGGRAQIAACNDGSMPLEPYQLISQYTLEPLLKAEAEALTGRHGPLRLRIRLAVAGRGWRHRDACEPRRMPHRDPRAVHRRVRRRRERRPQAARHPAARRRRTCSACTRRSITAPRCTTAFRSATAGPGPSLPHGRRPGHVPDHAGLDAALDAARRLSNGRKTWPRSSSGGRHAGAVRDALRRRLEAEPAAGGPLRDGRVFLAGDAAHLVIPTGGLGMNTGVGDAIDLSWKLAATLQGWGGPNLLALVRDRTAPGRRPQHRCFAVCVARAAQVAVAVPARYPGGDAVGQATRENLGRMADVEQRKTNEMIGAELGYRYVGSPDRLATNRAGPSTSFASTCRRRGRARGCRTSGSATARRSTT